MLTDAPDPMLAICAATVSLDWSILLWLLAYQSENNKHIVNIDSSL
jgi:hypothetical protein